MAPTAVRNVGGATASASRLRVVVITDRKLVGGAEIAKRLTAILAAVPRGSVMIQVREKDLDGGPLLQLVRDLVAVGRPAGALVWVNDRADVARIAGADGVHLPEHGLVIDDARAVDTHVGNADARDTHVGNGLAIGCSRHTVDGVLAAARAGAILIQLGPIWATPNKGTPLGLDALAVGRTLPPATRLVAVGGIDGPARARHAAASGADAIAVIRAVWQASDPAHVVASLVEAVDAGIAARG